MQIIIVKKAIGHFGIKFLSPINKHFWGNGQAVYLEQLFKETQQAINLSFEKLVFQSITEFCCSKSYEALRGSPQ